MTSPISHAEAAASFTSLLAAQEPFFDRVVQRPQGLMRVRGYRWALTVPEVMVSAVRAVVFKEQRVIVLTESGGTRHVMPGGRREAGESLEATVRRELFEECGWHVGELRQFAFLHFEHAGPAPPADWCDFTNLIYLTEGLSYDRRRLDPTQGKVRSRLTPFKVALGTLAEPHQSMLREALSVRPPPPPVD